MENYQLVLESGFVGYFIKSVIVTVGAVAPVPLHMRTRKVVHAE